MKKALVSGLLVLALSGALSGAETPPQEAEPAVTRHSTAHKILLYLPNRVFDVLDVVRARLRVGPGFAVGARVTKLTDVFLGSYASVFAGLPGPRPKPGIPWPVGVESRSGLAASVADATVTGDVADPAYSNAEVGMGFQLLLVGAEVGVDPLEIADFALGLMFVDLSGDDL